VGLSRQTHDVQLANRRATVYVIVHVPTTVVTMLRVHVQSESPRLFVGCVVEGLGMMTLGQPTT
jgi:hypothetical protein